MTDTAVNDYLDLLNATEQALVKNSLHCLESSGTIQSYSEPLQCLLVSKPYPTLQILTLIYDKAKYCNGRIITAALLELLQTNDGNAYTPNFISFLANLPLQILEAATLEEKLYARLTQTPHDVDMQLALLAHKDPQLLQTYRAKLQETWQTCKSSVPSKDFVLHQALQHGQHFVLLMCKQLKDFNCIKDVAIRNNLLILKLVIEFSQSSQALVDVANLKPTLAAFDIDNAPQELREIQQYFYADFQRLNVILDFLRQHSGKAYRNIKVDSLLRATGVLRLLYEDNIDASYEDVHRLIEATYRWQAQAPALRCIREQELETLYYYTTLKLIFEIIAAKDAAAAPRKLQQLNALLRHMRGMNTLCALLEDIFRMVFLRWEQLQPHQSSNESLRATRNKFTRKGSSLDDDDADGNYYDDDELKPPPPISAVQTETTVHTNRRHGFICRGPALKLIFACLKQYVTKKLHSEDYKYATEHTQLRFQRIIEVINEALWKYGVLEKIDEAMQQANGTLQQQTLEPEEVMNLVQPHSDTFDKTSSDDDSRERLNYASLTRRKAKVKRRRATFSGCIETPNELQARMISSVNDKCRMSADEQLRVQNLVRRFTERSIIPKMLGTPENLAIMALALKNFSDVKYIIETFHLQNTALNAELQFVEQQQQVKQKLRQIFANYLQQVAKNSQQSSASEPLATVEQIKNVAALGFETSKIISIVHNFAQAHKIPQSEELKHLLQQKYNNHDGQYDFLHVFDESNLNAIIIMDLVVNLPFNREITAQLLNIIRRQQQMSGSQAAHKSKDNTSGKPQFQRLHSQLPREIGPVMLLEQLHECMQVLEACDQKKTLSQLMTDNYYSLKPQQLQAQLNREAIFKRIYEAPITELSSSAQLKKYACEFQSLHARHNYFERFSAYVAQLERLMQLRELSGTHHINELLQYDVYRVIGELIYDCNMTPLEIEANVSALHLNLVHVIALNICSEVASEALVMQPRKQRPVSTQKQTMINNYIAQHNQLLAYLLCCVQQGDIVADKTLHVDCLQRLLALPELETLAPLYDGNKVITALCKDQVNMTAIEGLPDKRQRLNILLLQVDNRGGLQAKRQQSIDRLIAELIAEDSHNITLAVHINDVGLRAHLLYENFTKLSTTREAKELIECTLQHKDAKRCIPAQLRADLEHTLADITVYARVSEVLQFETWPQVYDFGRKTPNAIFEKLLVSQNYQLCYEWCVVVKLVTEFAAQQSMLMATLLSTLLKLTDDPADAVDDTEIVCLVDPYLLKILELFSLPARVEFLDKHKDKFSALSLLQYAIDFLFKHASQPWAYKNYKVSVAICQQLTLKERRSFWPLLCYPLLIVEQVIMNAKFEILAKVLDAARTALQSAELKQDLLCSLCYDKHGHIYDIHSKGAHAKLRFQLGQQIDANAAGTAFILLNFNLYQKHHIITNECIDLLLRIYATKALDYHIADLSSSSSEQNSQTTDMHMSLDSLCGAFQLPRQAPRREDWVRDEDATHCMCCRRAAFTMLMRRHHCRRCGRVVCFACSTHRMRIPELYEAVEVRICNDCHERSSREVPDGGDAGEHAASSPSSRQARIRQRTRDATYKWRLSGNITHDKLLREEFCYEHAPSVALSLSILDYHLGQQKCVDLLLYHCRKLEKLIVPNPEVDYELVAKMINCLALAAKVRGAPAEVETICEHSEIIMSVVQKGCEALIPPGPMNNHSLRKLADSLVQAEHWSLALEVHLKCGFATTGVMAAHGLACLRAGCYDTAREKFSHCMTRLTNEHINSLLFKQLFFAASPAATHDNNDNSLGGNELPHIKRPQRGPPLLQEILKQITAMPNIKPQAETLQRASLIRTSNSSLASLFSRRKEPYVVTPLHEPALTVLNTLANLKHIAKGNYSNGVVLNTHSSNSNSTSNCEANVRRTFTRNFEEAMHYVLTYGAHVDIVQYLMQQQELLAALKYYFTQQLEVDLFIHHIFLPNLRVHQLEMLIAHMQQLNDNPCHQTLCRAALLQTSAYLEKQKHLNVLYQLQLLLKDPIRASMTCVRFYAMNCENFQQLHGNAQHLRNAHLHLQTELELYQWEHLQLEAQKQRKNSLSTSRRPSNVSTATTSLGANFAMQLDVRALNGHINTILKQLDVAKFLAECEQQTSDEEPSRSTMQLLKQIRLDTKRVLLPTLFEGVQDKIQLCILILLCGKNIEQGFGLAYRIIQDYKLSQMKVYGATAKFLARNERLPEVEKLINCITGNNGTSVRDLDELLSIAINSAVHTHEPAVKSTLDNLVKRINNVELRISCHIFLGQLKSAYLLANKYERLMDVRKILRQAEIMNQMHIKKLCEKKLNINATPNLATL